MHSMMQYFIPLVGVYVPLAVKVCTTTLETNGVEVVLTPWIVVALVHCAHWPLVGVPTLETLPPPPGVAQDGSALAPFVLRNRPEVPAPSRDQVEAPR